MIIDIYYLFLSIIWYFINLNSPISLDVDIKLRYIFKYPSLYVSAPVAQLDRAQSLWRVCLLSLGSQVQILSGAFLN